MKFKKLYFAMLTLLAASCASDDIGVDNTTLNGDSKTPIAVNTTLGHGPVSRAFDKTFENGDKLFAYIDAGNKEGDVFTYEEQFHWANSFTVGETVDNGGDAGVGNITTTDKLTPTLYWDDFSSVEYDLRSTTVDRGIRLKYGYCYNEGESNASNKDVTEGTLTWTIPTDQSTADAMKHSDLLYAATQPMIKYGHDSRGSLTLPYTHAMSKVTINVTTGPSYSSATENFKNAVMILKDMQVKSDVNAPAATVTAVSPSGTADVTTYNSNKENTTATYQAIIGPTNLSTGNILATITNIDGNSYDIPVTQGILDAWSQKLLESTEEIQNGVAQSKSRAGIPHGQGYTTKPGIHYILDVTVDKQKITIRATITDWENIKANGKAAINFVNDKTTTGTIADELKASGFDVYKSSTNTEFTTKSTTVKFADSKWNYAPAIYWAGQSDNSYFRAIAPAGASTSELTQGTDLMWGTSGNEAIAPRTGDVELSFQHLMSKLCVKLETTNDASAVNLDGATVKITNLATTGSYNIVDASVSAGSLVETMLSGKTSGFIEYVVPQTIGNDARVIITLADGTTYSLQLNKCVLTDTETPVGEWTKGKSYTYTIHLEKEQITFCAVVKLWDEASGSGNATLEWD